MDPAPTSSPPNPETGWSRRIERLSPALVCPPTASRLVQACGVFGPDGWCEASATWRIDRLLMEPVAERPEPVRRVGGEHLWCGQLWTHFGHFLCESLSRLWAIEHCRPKSLIFIPKRPGKRQFPAFQRRLLDLLGIDLPIRLIRRPNRVARLVVPGQGFGMGEIARGTPEFRDFMQRRLAPHVAPEGTEKLYISRTGLGGRKGGILLEELIEERMAAEGYEIFRPEEHALEVQIARYRAARRVVGLDGSAFHLFGFVARPEQRAAVILRRNNKVYRSILWQIEGATGHLPSTVSAVTADWLPEGTERANRSSFGELDFAAIGRGLAEAGMIARPELWQAPAPALLAEAVTRAEAAAGHALNRHELAAMAPLPAAISPERGAEAAA